jgi:hypothetical protein
MKLSLQKLLDAIETSMFLLPELPGMVDWLDTPGLTGREINGSDAFVSLMGCARLTEQTATAAIEQVYARFTRQNKAFGWIVGPNSTPPDLTRRLASIGMEKALELAGMVYDRLDVPIPSNPDVTIREVTPADVDLASVLLSESIGFTPAGGRATVEALALSSSPLKRRAYMAYLPETETPVAYASMIYLPDQPIVVLYCAGTLEAARGHGVYTSLVARRLADAHRDGMQAAVIQAVSTSSAPICAKLGFVELCHLDWYIWEPEEGEKK